jgi:NTE family protein
MAGSIHIMQDRITRARMAGDPPDVVLSPRLAHLGLMDFDHASEAINAGVDCVRLHLPLLRDVLNLPETAA